MVLPPRLSGIAPLALPEAAATVLTCTVALASAVVGVTISAVVMFDTVAV